MQVNIEKRHLYILIAIIVFLAGAGIVIAFGSEQPRVHGHDIGEIEGSSGSAPPITGSCAGRVMVGVDSSGRVICENDDVGSGSGSDTRCDTSGRCSQVCVGTSCRSTWPNEGLETALLTCEKTCPSSGCNCIASCPSGFTVTSWSCSEGDKTTRGSSAECNSPGGRFARGSGTCTRIDP